MSDTDQSFYDCEEVENQTRPDTSRSSPDLNLVYQSSTSESSSPSSSSPALPGPSYGRMSRASSSSSAALSESMQCKRRVRRKRLLTSSSDTDSSSSSRTSLKLLKRLEKKRFINHLHVFSRSIEPAQEPSRDQNKTEHRNIK